MLYRFWKDILYANNNTELTAFFVSYILTIYPVVHILGKPITRIYLKKIVRRIYEIRS